MLWRDEGSNYDYNRHLNRLKRDYKEVDITELEKLFKEKKIKFDVVRHKDVNLVDPINGEKMLIKTKKTI